MAGRKGPAARAHQRVGLWDRLRRSRPFHPGLDRQPENVRCPDAARRQENGERDALTGEEGDRDREGDPDRPEVTDGGQADENGVEPSRSVLDDPDEDVVIYRRLRSCFVDSISACGSKGLPMKACAPSRAARLAVSSSTLPLNMITGTEPTP
jgi:hypothetical protein